MKEEIRIKKLMVPSGRVDVVLDTDAHNEIDDQYAIAYLLSSKDKLTTKAIYAAPYSKDGIVTPQEGMEKSYKEIFKILSLMEETVEVLKGATEYLPDEKTPVVSSASLDLAKRANEYSAENPLYVLAIGAITNIASAILLNPKVAENTVVVWLGGHAYHYPNAKEFNLKQDITAARVVFGSGVPLIHLPCQGVVSAFTISKPELEKWFVGKNELADYLSTITIKHVEEQAHCLAWSKPIWDVTAVAWLLNDNGRFIESRLQPTPLPSYDGYYTQCPNNQLLNYVYFIKRDNLLEDLINKLTQN